MPQLSKLDQLLASTFEEASLSLISKAATLQPAPVLEVRSDGSLWTVESHGCVLLPPTADKREAEQVYNHSSSRGKVLMKQIGHTRIIVETNDWRLMDHGKLS